MRTVLLGEPPKELQAWLDRRRELGQDGFDEVWEGDYHVAPMAHGRQGAAEYEVALALRARARRAGLRGSGPINVGQADNYRFLTAPTFGPGRPLSGTPRQRSSWRSSLPVTKAG